MSRFPVHSDVTFGSRLAVVFALRCCLELLNFKTWPISLQGPSHTITRELMKRKLSNNWIELANRRFINVSRQKCLYQKGIFNIIGCLYAILIGGSHTIWEHNDSYYCAQWLTLGQSQKPSPRHKPNFTFAFIRRLFLFAIAFCDWGLRRPLFRE